MRQRCKSCTDKNDDSVQAVFTEVNVASIIAVICKLQCYHYNWSIKNLLSVTKLDQAAVTPHTEPT